MDANTAVKAGKVTTGRVCIDAGSTTDVVEDLVIRDRKHLSEDGIVLAIITINKRTGKVESAPEVVTRGFVTGEIALGDQAREIVNRTLDGVLGRREGRLRRDEREDPSRSQALHSEEHVAPADDHADYSGNLIV